MSDETLPPPEAVDPEPTGIRSPVWSHVLPFVAWLFIMQMLGDPAGWKYAVRTVLCLGFFIYLKPWRWYSRIELKNLPLAVAVGVAVFFVWIFFETDFMAQWPAIQDGYLKYATQPPWKMPEVDIDLAYAPETCGWSLTIIRILGSACVIAVIEEFFWRGFLYRWLIKEDFLPVDLGTWHTKMFIIVCLFFGLEHFRWFVGILAGVAYGWMAIRTRDVWAVSVAHGITNLLLGLYVVWADKYLFWS
jgi:hypothetical protein